MVQTCSVCASNPGPAGMLSFPGTAEIRTRNTTQLELLIEPSTETLASGIPTSSTSVTLLAGLLSTRTLFSLRNQISGSFTNAQSGLV
jgi:hypothetical protein